MSNIDFVGMSSNKPMRGVKCTTTSKVPDCIIIDDLGDPDEPLYEKRFIQSEGGAIQHWFDKLRGDVIINFRYHNVPEIESKRLFEAMNRGETVTVFDAEFRIKVNNEY